MSARPNRPGWPWYASLHWIAALTIAFPVATLAAPEDELARDLLATSAVQGGVIAHLGCGDGRLTAALGARDGFVVHGLDTEAGNVEAARRHVQSVGRYGRVTIERLDGSRLPYPDNFVNLLVAENLGSVPMAEVLRVLVPGGVACLKSDGTWKTRVKPRPPQMDEWTHYLHEADNNAVSRDTLVGPPRHLQWIAAPKSARHHDHMASLSALVSANGRVFYIIDEGPTTAILLPPKWTLVARDAFNGTLLWKKPIAEWNTHLWPLKSGPNQLPRRLVAVGDRVFVTLGIDAPVSILDAATGEVLRAAEGTVHTDEILFADGTLFALVAQSPNKWKDYRPKFTYVWDNTRRANTEWAWDRENRWVMALDPHTGRIFWKQEQRVAPLTLAVDRERVYLHDGEKALALSRTNGQPLWTSEPITRKQPFPTGYGPTLVVQEGVVLISVESSSMTALDAATGKTLWAAKHHRGGHASPDDLLVIDGLVWCGAIAASSDSGVFTGRDLRTGEVKREFPCDAQTYWFHHRCYRARATERFVLTSRTGIEFVDLTAQHWDIHHWVRGGCLYGIMPANGLLYVPPHSCACYVESKLNGFTVLAADAPGRRVLKEPSEENRLERGPAFSEISNLNSQFSGAADWPTYRGDAARSGRSKMPVPTNLKSAWQTSLGGKLSSPVVADGKVFVAAVDAHTVHALDADTGRPLWNFTAGGRVDTPPTIFEGRALFGSADGWVYCLRASDGRLCWRFRAAPEERRLMAYDQLESPWPLHGSVLVVNGAVWAVAGRSMFLDNGMRLVQLDARTGRTLSETILNDRVPETGEPLQQHVKALDMPVALPDILSCDGRFIYMRSQRFDLTGRRVNLVPSDAKDQTGEGVHLFARTGFADDTLWHRSFWMYGKSVSSGYGSWFRPGAFAPTGRLMVFNDDRVYGFDRKPEYLCNASVYEYFLYGADKETKEERIQAVAAATSRINAASPKKSAIASDWALRQKFSPSELTATGFQWAEENLPIQARGMVLAGETLFVAGPPDLVNEQQAITKLDDPDIKAKLAEQAAAFEGRRGAQLLAFAATDGKPLAAHSLDSLPVFDGLAAARGRLYLATTDGQVLCLGLEGAPLKPAPIPALAALDTAVRTTAARFEAESATAEFATVIGGAVYRGEPGYFLRAENRATAVALKKLDAPLTQQATFKFKLRLTEGTGLERPLRNGFLAFGDSPDETALVKCGLRFAAKTAVIAQGRIGAPENATQSFPNIELDRDYEVTVTVDLPSSQVTMKAGPVTVTSTLARRLPNIAFVGYCAQSAATGFGPLEILGR